LACDRPFTHHDIVALFFVEDDQQMSRNRSILPHRQPEPRKCTRLHLLIQTNPSPIMRGPGIRSGRLIPMNGTLTSTRLVTPEFRNQGPNCFHLPRTSSMSHGISTCGELERRQINS
jgi:hypothetical protein